MSATAESAHQARSGVVAPSSATRSLTQRIGVFPFPHHDLAEWRATDFVARYRVTTQSVWKLNCGASVGGQTILGIKHLNELARLVAGHRWPLEGWSTLDGPAIWFAQIFPSLVRYPEWNDEYNTRARSNSGAELHSLRCRARFGRTTQKEDFAKPGTLDAAKLAKVRTKKVGSCRCESYGVPRAEALPSSAAEPPRRHPASITMFARA
jgi:hypothetical protein